MSIGIYSRRFGIFPILLREILESAFASQERKLHLQIQMNPCAKSSPVLALPIAVSLFAMALLDFVTGQELAFSCAYLVPVALTAWWFQRVHVVVMALLCGTTAFIVDRLDGYEYSHPSIEYWNAFTCFVISIITGLVLSRLKKSFCERIRMTEELQLALQKLEESTAEIRKLQSGLQTVCAWTKRIKVGDKWMSPDEFLSTQLHLQLSHGMSPEAYEEMRRSLSRAA